jgi:phage baseplate assembly protein W
MDAAIKSAWRKSVEAEVNRRLAERERAIDVEKVNITLKAPR